MKTKLILVLCAACIFSACSKQSEEETKLALAREVFLANTPMIERLTRQLNQDDTEFLATLPEEKRAEGEKMIKELKAAFEEFDQKSHAIYAEVYTMEELKAMKAFYKSPGGRAYLAEVEQRSLAVDEWVKKVETAAKEGTPRPEFEPKPYEMPEALKAFNESPEGRSIAEKLPLLQEKMMPFSMKVKEIMRKMAEMDEALE